MIRKKWRDGEVVLSIETEDEFGKAIATGEAVELTRELADQLGMMEDDTITGANAYDHTPALQSKRALEGGRKRREANRGRNLAIDPVNLTLSWGLDMGSVFVKFKGSEGGVT